MKLSYRGYTTRLAQDPSSTIWHGRVCDIRDVVAFEGKTQVAAEQEFYKSIEAYLRFCQAIGRSPEKPDEATPASAAAPPDSAPSKNRATM